MTTKDEALALALEALEESIDDVRQCLGEILRNAGYARYDRQIAAYSEQIVKHEAAITAIKQAQQAQEPVQSGFFSKEAMMAHHILKDHGIAPKQAKPAQG